MADAFLIRLIIAIGVYFFFDIVIKRFVRNADARGGFELVLLGACILYLIFGKFLPF